MGQMGHIWSIFVLLPILLDSIGKILHTYLFIADPVSLLSFGDDVYYIMLAEIKLRIRMSTPTVTVKYHADFKEIPFLNSCHADIDDSKRGHTGIVVDFENGDWNYLKFKTWIHKHIPKFALTKSELANITPDTMVELTTRAAKLIHDRDKKLGKKGEIGEIILHGLLVDIFGTEPLVSKIYYKTDPTENVKGFDSVHVVYKENEDKIGSLWLGEAKFHRDYKNAISKAFASVEDFLQAKKLRREFMIVKNHIDQNDERKSAAEQLLSNLKSLDEIRSLICVPVLIAYESPETQKHKKMSDEYMESIDIEIQKCLDAFSKKFVFEDEVDVDVHVFFMPLKDKAKALSVFTDEISSLQGADIEV